MHLVFDKAVCTTITEDREVCTHSTHPLSLLGEPKLSYFGRESSDIDSGFDVPGCNMYSQVFECPLPSATPFWEYVLARIAFVGSAWVMSRSLPPSNGSGLQFIDRSIASLKEGLFKSHFQHSLARRITELIEEVVLT